MNFDKKTLKRIFLGVVGCILLYWILHETERFRSVFTFLEGAVSPFLLGAGLAFIINVPMRSIENRFVRIKNPLFRRTAALVLTMLAIALVLAFVFYMLVPQVTETAQGFVASLPPFFNKVHTTVMEFINSSPYLVELLQENNLLEQLNLSAIIEKALDMVGNSVSTIVTGTFLAIGDIATVMVNAVIGIVFAVYCLFSKETLIRQGRKLLYAYLPETWSDNVIRVLRLTNSTFSNFLSGQCLEVCILGCMFAVSMAIFRMPYIPLVSVLVAVTAFIPVVGAFVGCILGAFFILVNDPLQAVGFVVLFLVVQQIEGNLIYPRVVGDSIGLPGMWVLLAVAVGGELMGVAGMFLMIPLSSVVYTLMKEITNLRLDRRQVDKQKLVPQPLEYQSHLKKQSANTFQSIKKLFSRKKTKK